MFARYRIETTAEVWTHEVGFFVGYGGGDTVCFQTGGGELGCKFVGGENRHDRITGAGMREAEIEHRLHALTAAGAAEGDAGGGVAPEAEPRIAARSGGVDVGEGINA